MGKVRTRFLISGLVVLLSSKNVFCGRKLCDEIKKMFSDIFSICVKNVRVAEPVVSDERNQSGSSATNSLSEIDVKTEEVVASRPTYGGDNCFLEAFYYCQELRDPNSYLEGCFSPREIDDEWVRDQKAREAIIILKPVSKYYGDTGTHAKKLAKINKVIECLEKYLKY